MATYTGEATIRLTNLEAGSKEELTKALTWLMPVIAEQMHDAMAKTSKPKVDLSVSGTAGPQGASANVGVSGSIGGGTVTGSVGVSSGGGTSASVTGTWRL